MNLRFADAVKIVNVGGPLSNKTGRIVGVAYRDIVNIYIVELDALSYHNVDFGPIKAVAIPEMCLERIGRVV